MTEQLTLSLEKITRLMYLALCNGDEKTFAELAPQRHALIVESVQFSLTGGVQ